MSIRKGSPMSHRERINLSTLSALAAIAVGCSGGASERPAAVLPGPSLSPAPPPVASAPRDFAGEPIALSAVNLPDNVVVDGSISEWGLDAKRNIVAIGISKTKVVLAIAWAEPERPIVTLALANLVPMLPEIGWSQRGGTTHELTAEGCEFEQIPLIEAGWTNGRRQPPEVTRACKEVLARYEKASAGYRERFIRRLRIDTAGVSLLDGAGASAPLAGAVVRSQATSAEVELPLTALPDINQAPLVFILAGAVFGELPEGLRTPPSQGHPSSEEKPALDAAWTRLELKTPVGFGDHPDILALVFEDPSGVMNGGVMSQISYAPARPETFSIMTVPDVAVAQSKVVPKVPGAIGGPTGPDRPALYQEESPLFTPVDTFGKVTIVLARGSLVTLVGNKIVAEESFGQPEATHRRGEDLHFFKFRPGGYNPMVGFYPAQWSAVAIKPDGKIVPIADEGVDMPGMSDAWDTAPKTFNSPDWTSFGLRGQRGGKPKTVTWQWDATKSHYVSSVVPKI